LFAGEEPQLAGRRVYLVENHAVLVRRPLRPAVDPPLVGEHFQMPADGRLRELEDVAQVHYAQLVPLQQVQQAEARLVRERLHAAEQRVGVGSFGGGSNHPIIRLIGWIVP
jgi:hypothetical protein